MMFSKSTPAVLATFFFGLTLGGSALACSTDGWHEVVGLDSTIFVGSPSPEGITRVEALCGMRATGMGHVQHHTGLSHTRARFRFYAFPQFTGTGYAKIFVLYDNDAPDARGAVGELFHIAYDGATASWVFDASANGGGSTSFAVTGGFDLMEIDWDTDGDTLDIWMNADSVGSDNIPPGDGYPATGSIDPGGPATAEAARLGLPDGPDTLGGSVTFDYYAATSTLPIGSVLRGDANGDGLVNGLDFQGTQLDLAGVFQTGFPDCDLSGGLSGLDFQCVQIAIAGGFPGYTPP